MNISSLNSEVGFTVEANVERTTRTKGEYKSEAKLESCYQRPLHELLQVVGVS